MHDHGFRIAPVGHGFVVAVDPVVGADHALVAVLLLTLLARIAGATGIDDAAHANLVTDLVLADLLANRRDPADDFMPRHHRVDRAAPVVLGKVDIGVADAAVVNLDGNVIRAQGPTLDGMGSDARGFRLGGIGFNCAHTMSLLGESARYCARPSLLMPNPVLPGT